jgi:hypothetical protein
MMADSISGQPRRTLDTSAFRPGFRGPTTATMTDADVAAAKKIDRAYKIYDFIVKNAWRGPGSDVEMDRLYEDAGAGEHGEQRSAQAGDVCTVRSGAGRFGPEGSEFVENSRAGARRS